MVVVDKAVHSLMLASLLVGIVWTPITETNRFVWSSTGNSKRQLVAFADEPLTEWNNTYGGEDDDFAYALIQASDGGYAMAGYTKSFGAGGFDFWLVKTDAEGTILWNKTFGGENDDWAHGLVETSDGGYALAGRTKSFGAGCDDAWLVKTDAQGTMVWNKTYGGKRDDAAQALIVTSDGGYAMAGTREKPPEVSVSYGDYDFWLVKTDADGNALWNRTYAGTGGECACSLIETSDGGYVLAGDSFGEYLFWLVKTDAGGNALWNKTYEGALMEEAKSVIQTSDGGYALTAHTSSIGAGNNDFWLVKTDSLGNLQWDLTQGGTNDDYAFALAVTSDGGYALAGWSRSFGAGNGDFYLVKRMPPYKIPDYVLFLVTLPAVAFLALLTVFVYRKIQGLRNREHGRQSRLVR